MAVGLELRGDARDELGEGGDGDDLITGGAGWDLIVGGLGADLLDGGLGLDAAVFTGKRADYKISVGKDGATVASLRVPDEVDSLSGIERVKFDDAMLGFDVDGVAGQAYRLYQAAFNRAPDMAGLGYWIGRMDGGASLKDVASAFTGSQEFAQMYGAKPSNAEFLGKIYQNILHRAPARPTSWRSSARTRRTWRRWRACSRMASRTRPSAELVPLRPRGHHVNPGKSSCCSTACRRRLCYPAVHEPCTAD